MPLSCSAFATSIPMVLAAGEGEYDLIPTFTESDKSGGAKSQHLMTTAELRSASLRLERYGKPAQNN